MTKEHEAWLALTKEDPIEPDLPICDPHHHLWDRPNDEYYLNDFLKDAKTGHRIVRTVFVECRAMYRKSGPEEMKPVGEIEFVNGIAEQAARDKKAGILVASGMVGYADLTLGAKVAPVLEAEMAAAKNHFKGIRNITTWHENPETIMSFHNAPKGLVLDRTFREGFALLKKYNLSYDSWQYFPQLPEITDLAKAFPDTSIIVNHVGGMVGIGPYAGKRDEVFKTWKRNMAALAACPNVFVKLGGLGTPRCGFGWYQAAKPPTSAEVAKTLAPYYLSCIEQFGANRCMFESNFPVDKISFSYNVMWNSFKLITKGFSAQERKSLFHDTAVKAYRLPVK